MKTRLRPLPAYLRLPSESSKRLCTIRRQVYSQFNPVIGMIECAIADRMSLNLLRQERAHAAEIRTLVDANEENELNTSTFRQTQLALNALIMAFDKDAKRLKRLQAERKRREAKTENAGQQAEDRQGQDNSTDKTVSNTNCVGSNNAEKITPQSPCSMVEHSNSKEDRENV